MWPHFVHLLARAWDSVLSSLSTSTLSIILFSLAAPIVTFVVSLVTVWKRHPERTLLAHLRESVAPTAIGFTVPLVLIAFVFGWNVITTIYSDHEASIAKLIQLRNVPKPICPSCPACPNPIGVVNPSLRPIEEWREIADSLYGPFSANKGVLVVLTAPQQNMSAKNAIYQLMVEVDRRNPPGSGPVIIEPVPDPGGSDADIRPPSHNGILVHCSNTLLASMVTRALHKWFIVQSTAIETTNGIKKYGPKEDELNHWTYVWIEIGNGNVWR
jgi:hypothetical protein